ncbi:MAG: bacteriophage holin [Candidatus Zixiibacteriota bacterium]|nr:MAG: bacteriophage holin [candidate division Zixibacteria bacterium]
MKLNVKALALTLGILWGLSVFILTWWIILFEGATGEITLIGKVYRGFCISPTGSLIGFLWGFFDGLIAGALVAWVYNWFVDRFSPSPVQ